MAKILVIDDKPDNLLTIEALLHHLKPEYNVLKALSGTEGIKIAQKQQPDTIILDIIMPGMDGYETCRILKNDPATKNIPVLMLTAIKTDTQSRIKGLRHGADAFSTKPIDTHELGAQIEVLLRIKRSEDQLRREKDKLLENVDAKTRALLENEIKLNQIIEGFSIPAFIIDKDHKVTHFNKALEILSNLNARDIVGTCDHWKILYPSPRPILADLVLDQVEKKVINDYYTNGWKQSYLLPEAIEAEKVMLDENSRDRWYYLTATPIKDDNGNIQCALETIQDITSQKINEIELENHRKHLEELVRKRTQQLEDKNLELERMNNLFVGREFRIKELREQVKNLQQDIEILKK